MNGRKQPIKLYVFLFFLGLTGNIILGILHVPHFPASISLYRITFVRQSSGRERVGVVLVV